MVDMKATKYKTTVFLTSCKQPDGSTKSFKPGDVVEAKYITPESIDQYLKGGVLENVDEKVK